MKSGCSGPGSILTCPCLTCWTCSGSDWRSSGQPLSSPAASQLTAFFTSAPILASSGQSTLSARTGRPQVAVVEVRAAVDAERRVLRVGLRGVLEVADGLASSRPRWLDVSPCESSTRSARSRSLTTAQRRTRRLKFGRWRANRSQPVRGTTREQLVEVARRAAVRDPLLPPLVRLGDGSVSRVPPTRSLDRVDPDTWRQRMCSQLRFARSRLCSCQMEFAAPGRRRRTPAVRSALRGLAGR